MSQSQNQVCTIGYQGKHIDEFIKLVLMNQVDVLVDVRRKAISRKPGFSKTKLREALEDVGVAYVHLPQLGMPVELMPKRNLTDNSEILTEYTGHLSKRSAEIEFLHAKVNGKRICLLCFEHDHELCHRSVLAAKLASDDKTISIQHL